MKPKPFLKRALASMAVAAVIAPAVTGAQAQQKPIDYPVDTITMITHSSPGGGSDVLARAMSDYLSKVFGGTNVVVKNVVGGSSAAALAEVATAPPDGSVVYCTTPTYIFTSLMADLSYSYSDLMPLVNYISDPQVLYTSADAPFDNVQEMLEYAERERLAWGAASPGSLERITLERLKRLTGANAAIVTSEGGGDTMLNVLNKTLDLAQGEVQELRPQLEAGKLKLLAVLTEERLKGYPNVPTVQEAGIDLTLTKFRGLAAPKGMSKDVIRKWEMAIQRVLKNPEFEEWYTKQAMTAHYIPNDEYSEFIPSFATDKREFLVDVGVIR